MSTVLSVNQVDPGAGAVADLTRPAPWRAVVSGVEPEVAGHRRGGGAGGANALVGRDCRWHVLHTRSRQEKTVAEVLEAAGVEVYLPTIRTVRFYGHRKRAVDAPLFSCYVFLWGPVEAAYFAVGTKRVAQIIPVPDQARLGHELSQLRGVLSRGGNLASHAYLVRGRRARVRSGPFKGVEGLVEEHIRQDRLVLQVTTLGRAASLEIDAGLLEPVE